MTKHFKFFLLCVLALALCFTAACGGAQEAAHADLEALYARMQSSVELPELFALSPKRVRNYYGIDPDACPQLLMLQCADSLRVDEIWLIEAADEAAAQELEGKAQARIEQLATETQNYFPDQYAVVQKARAVRVGSTVALFVSPDAEALEKLFREAF